MPAVLMPRLSDATEEATIVAWLVEDGAPVRAGDEIVEIETDKATTAFSAETAGTLRIDAAPGDTVRAGATIARIEAADGTAEAIPFPAASTPEPGPTPEPSPAPEPTPPAEPTPPTEPGSSPSGSSRRAPSRIERLVADRMVRGRTEIPDFAVTVDIDMQAALALRADLKAVGAVGGGRTPSVNDLVVKACALALRDHPRIRSAWTDDAQVVQYDDVHVGVAVATDDGGLVVPVVRDADRLGLGALAARTRELAARARTGRVQAQDLAGATFTISNLGALGVDRFTAIVSPGQGAILAVGAIADRVVPVDGAPAVRPVLSVTLCSDHRVIYGAHAAAFLDRLRAILEHPGALAL